MGPEEPADVSAALTDRLPGGEPRCPYNNSDTSHRDASRQEGEQRTRHPLPTSAP